MNLKVKCDTCKKNKEGIEHIIEYEDKKLNATRRIKEYYCFDCLKNDPIIKVLIHE